MTSTARDIPKVVKAREDGFVTTGRNAHVARKFDPLPTPPNSLSTSLPKCGSKSYETRSLTAQLALEGLESNTNTRNHYNEDELSSSDTIGDITPALLAHYHLPNILLEHGPLAIRNIMGLLTIAVPGFARIPPTKARRLVVSALEAHPVKEDNVIFEKVGWGRWEAKSKSCATPYHSGSRQSPSLITSALSSHNLANVNEEQWKSDRSKINTSDSTWKNNTTVFFNDDQMDVHLDGMLMMPNDNDNDKMSIDDDEICSFSGSEDEGIVSNDSADMTDDEDWAALGAAALRAASYSTSNPRNNFTSSFTKVDQSSQGDKLCVSIKAKSDCQVLFHDTDITSFEMNSNSLEREAVAALLRLSSI